MKKLVALILAFCCILPLAGCTNTTAPEIEVESFSYAEVLEENQGIKPGVRTGGFYNTSVFPISDAYGAIRRAQNECTVDYNTTNVYYDDTTDMWRVSYYKEGYLGGGQDVYLGGDGVTRLIVYGE